MVKEHYRPQQLLLRLERAKNVPLGAPPEAIDARYKGAYAAAPAIKLERVDHSLHFIMLDQPAAFAADLDGFLAG